MTISWAARGLMLLTMSVLGACGGGSGASAGATQAALSGSPSTTTATGTINATTAGAITQTSGKPGVLAISISPQLVPFPNSSAEYDALRGQAMQMAYNAGARGQISTFTWRDLEPSAGESDASKWAELSGALAWSQAVGLQQYVGLQVINTTARELPADLASQPFDAPVVQQRFKALLQRVLTLAPRSIRYLSIGNEVDVYLRAHADEQAPFLRFLTQAASDARSVDAAVKVGTTGTGAAILAKDTALLKALNDAASDVVMLTYYPTRGDATGAVTVRDPAEVPADLQALLRFAGSKPLVLQEVGYPAASETGSSEQKQALFVSQLFAAWNAANGQIPFINYFLLHDLTPDLCDQMLGYYGASGSPSLKAAMCSLGLRQADGTPRLAWQTLVDAASTLSLP